MHSFQDRILPLVEKQALIEPTPENLRDVSLCVALASGWKFEELPVLKCYALIAPNEEHVHYVQSGDLDVVGREFLAKGVIPAYAVELGAIYQVVTASFLQFSINLIQNRDAETMVAILAEFDHVDRLYRPTISRGAAAPTHPALALSLAYLHNLMERASHV